MEVRIPKEIRQHKEIIFFGLSARQFLCSVTAVVIAVGVYLLLQHLVDQETASWACILAAAPVAIAGFFKYNGMNLEQFLWAFLKSQILCSNPRRFISKNYHLTILRRKEKELFD